MKLHFKFFLQSITLSLVFTLLFSFSCFAAEKSNLPNEYIPLDKTNIGREEAIEALQLTPEEIEKCSLYVVETNGDILPTSRIEITDSSRTHIDSGEIFNPGFFTFNGTNTGKYRTLNGNKAKLAFIWTQTSTTAPCQMTVQFARYNQVPIWIEHPSNWNPGTNMTHTSDWINIEKGWDYNIWYKCVDLNNFNLQSVRISTLIAVY